MAKSKVKYVNFEKRKLDRGRLGIKGWTVAKAGAGPEINLTGAQPKARVCSYVGVALSMGSYTRFVFIKKVVRSCSKC